MKHFTKGQIVTYKDFHGYVNFISDDYITICIREYEKPSHEAEHAKSTIRQVCLCVYPSQWDYVTPNDSLPKDKFSTDIAEVVENIK